MTDLKVARYFQTLETGKLECLLCPVHCKLSEGQVGICFGRENRKGVLYAINYGEVVSLAVDPMEKKPLYHFYPGSMILSVGPNGCNLRCTNCQNWSISQELQPTRHFSPEQLVDSAKRANSIGIAYTYSEPLIWFEYIKDTATLARKVGLKTVLVTNGYINEDPFRELAHLIDAMNVDLKSMEEKFYRGVCKGSLEDVLRTIRIAVEVGIHVEVTNLVITTLNDSNDDFHRLVDWVSSLDRRIPLHFSRYFPNHEMDHPATPVDRLISAHKIASEKLDYVYIGNVALSGFDDTYCPNCKKLLIKRNGYQVVVTGIRDKKCRHCGTEVNITL